MLYALVTKYDDCVHAQVGEELQFSFEDETSSLSQPSASDTGEW